MGRHREFPVEKRSHHHTITPPSDGYLAGLRVQWCYGLMEKTRDRTLSGDELRAIWAATGGDGDYARIVRLCHLGPRPSAGDAPAALCGFLISWAMPAVN
jgi:hypothetical protein